MEKYKFLCKCEEDTILIYCSSFRFEEVKRAVLSLGAYFENGEFVIRERRKFKAFLVILSNLL